MRRYTVVKVVRIVKVVRSMAVVVWLNSVWWGKLCEYGEVVLRLLVEIFATG